MAITVSVDGAPVEGVFSAPFFAIRVGTGPQNSIVIAANTPGIHEHHCTIVYTGSTYRIEMLPTHLVFVDGERGECGQQLFLHDTRRCVLSLGGAAPPIRRAGARNFALPPQITLERVGAEAKVVPPKRPWGPTTNRDVGKFVRVSVRNLMIGGLLSVLVLGGGVATSMVLSDVANAALAERLDKTARLADLPPRPEVALRARGAVFQIGLAKCGGATAANPVECDFYPAGTAWAWDDGVQRQLVTNIHVVKSINDCSQSRSSEASAKCEAPAGYCPAVRYFVGDGEEAVQKIEALVNCDLQAGIPARIHADYEAFSRWTRQSASTGGLPNVYDIAVIDWPGTLTWMGQPLKLARSVRAQGDVVQTGQGVGVFGFPAEGGLSTDLKAGGALFRPGSIGRTQDAFGLPSPEEHLLTISGPEVVGGESGGPVIDSNGDVVAMTFANFSQAGDAQLGRISYGARMKALGLRLLGEQDRFIPIDAPGLRPTEKRLALWNAGLNRMSKGRRDAVLSEFKLKPCPDGMIRRDRPVLTREVKASQATSFQVSSEGTAGGWSYSEDLDLGGAPDTLAYMVVMATSTGPSPHQVTLSYRRGKYARLESSDPTLTFASVPDEVAFSAQSTTPKAAFTLFTPDVQGRDAPFQIEIHQADCIPVAQP